MIPKIVAAVVFTVTSTAFARTFLVPQTGCGSVSVNVTSSVAPGQVARAYAYLPNHRVELKPSAEAKSLQFNVDVPADDLAMVAVDFAPQTTGNETRTEHAKSFIRCGDISRRDDWQLSANLGLEIVPQWNGLTPFKPGQSMRFIAIDQTAHKLVRDVPMELQFEGAAPMTAATPDANGGFTFPYKGPGRYMVSMTDRRPDPAGEGHWLTDTTTLTFDVK